MIILTLANLYLPILVLDELKKVCFYGSFVIQDSDSDSVTIHQPVACGGHLLGKVICGTKIQIAD